MPDPTPTPVPADLGTPAAPAAPEPPAPGGGGVTMAAAPPPPAETDDGYDDDEPAIRATGRRPRGRGRRLLVLSAALGLVVAALWAVTTFFPWTPPQGDQKKTPAARVEKVTATAAATAPGPLAVRGAPTAQVPAWVPSPMPATPTLFVRTDGGGVDFWAWGMTPLQPPPKVDWTTRTVRVEGRGHDAQGKEVVATMVATIPTTPGQVSRGGVVK